MTTQEALRQAAARIARSPQAAAARQAVADVSKLIAGSDTMPPEDYTVRRGDLGIAAAMTLELLLAEIDRQAAS